jgi:hypothetical protein
MSNSKSPSFSHNKNRSILITGACGVTSRTVVRALMNSSLYGNVRFIGTDICENPFGLYEGLYDRVYRVPALSEADMYERIIAEICAKEKIDAAIVIPEPEVLFWSERKMPVRSLLPPPKFSRLAISKKSLYEALGDTELVPKHAFVNREQIIAGDYGFDKWQALWLRDFSSGSTSGKGAICIRYPEEGAAWMVLNPNIDSFMISEFLPGRNLACLLLYHQGQLLKIGCYERLEYFMGKTVISGVSGNISKGRLINDSTVVAASVRAVEMLCAISGEIMNGLVTVDLRTDSKNLPKITEINLRPVAAASAFAEVPGANIAEAHLLATFGEIKSIGPMEVDFPQDNRILRDIDGLPLFVSNYRTLNIGEYIETSN